MTGQGGETIRGYWHGYPKEFIHNQVQNRTKIYPTILARELAHSLETILKSAFRTVHKNLWKDQALS